MNRKVLIITPFFAPQTHAAVFRAYKLAKYLPQFGWEPHVLTVDRNYLYNEDHGLLSELPPEVKVHTARYVEPSARGLRMALGGRDRTFAGLKSRGELSTTSAEPRVSTPRRLSLLREYFLKRWAQSPDAYWTWYGPALRAAVKLVRLHDIPLVFTSADPFTCHRLGRTLQRKGCRWVADLRDPHGYCLAMHSKFPDVFIRQRSIERDAVLHADAVTVASSAIALILADSYGDEAVRRSHFIPTGLDEAHLPDVGSTRPRPFPYLLFSGEYLSGYGSEFLEIFAAALERPEMRDSGVKLLVVGRVDVNRPQVEAITQRLGIGDRIEMIDHVPQRELYRLLRGAEAGVLLSSRHFRWWCLYAKMVDYLALRKPVVAVLPDPSEARTRLTRAGLGVFLDGEIAACGQMLASFLTEPWNRPAPVADECDLYLATTQVRSFVGVFESLMNPTEPGSASRGPGNVFEAKHAPSFV